MQMAVMQIVEMALVLYGGMSTLPGVFVLVAVMRCVPIAHCIRIPRPGTLPLSVPQRRIYFQWAWPAWFAAATGMLATRTASARSVAASATPCVPLEVQRARTFAPRSSINSVSSPSVRDRNRPSAARTSSATSTVKGALAVDRSSATATTCKPAAASRGSNLANCSSRARGAFAGNNTRRTGPFLSV